MRILHLNAYYPPQTFGGAEQSVALLAQAQASAGHQVAVACLAQGSATRESREGVEVFRMPHHTDFWPADWPNHSLRRREWVKFKQQMNLGLETEFAQVLDDFRPQVVNSHSMVDVSTRTWRAAARRGIPIVHTLRDFDLLCAASSMYRPSGQCKQRHLKCRTLTFTKQFDQRVVGAVTAVGHGILQRHLDASFFAHVPPSLRQVIWSGVAPVEWSLAPPRQGDLVLGFLGRISPEKGLDVLIDACRRLPLTGWRLRIGGAAAADMSGLRSRAEGLPIEWLGTVDPAAFLSQLDLLVVPSLWADPLPRVVIEAYAAGKPVLGARAGGIAELVPEAWLTPPGDIAALAERLAGILQGGREALPPPDAFQAVVAETSTALVCERFVRVYDRLLGVTGPPPSAPGA